LSDVNQYFVHVDADIVLLILTKRIRISNKRNCL